MLAQDAIIIKAQDRIIDWINNRALCDLEGWLHPWSSWALFRMAGVSLLGTEPLFHMRGLGYFLERSLVFDGGLHSGHLPDVWCF